jgi:hypothetical protein
MKARGFVTAQAYADASMGVPGWWPGGKQKAFG